MPTQISRTMGAGDLTELWASAQITALSDGKHPAYGTPEWRALPATDPRRAAALIHAAEMWRRYGDEQQLLDWFAEATRARPPLTLADTRTPRHAAPTHVRATPGWPPVAIPGQPGWRRHIDGDRLHDQDAQAAA